MNGLLRSTLALALIALSSGCYLTRASLRQERSRLELQEKVLDGLQHDLSNGTFPGGQRHVTVKIGYDLINQILAAADNMDVTLPEDPETHIYISKIRIGGSSTPFVDVAASARKYRVRVDVAATAMLVIEETPTGPPLAHVRIVNLAPVISWRQITLFRQELARKILTTKADQLAVNKLTFPLPVEGDLELAIPELMQEVEVPTRSNGSWIRYRIRKPGSHMSRHIKIDRVVFLSDGIHLYATVS